jgi:hypothetical protein
MALTCGRPQEDRAAFFVNFANMPVIPLAMDQLPNFARIHLSIAFYPLIL